MTAITAAAVKQLRERTGVGMMDCKKALAEVGGDMEAAIDWLRQKGLAAAGKAGRVTAEGLVAIKIEGGQGAMVEVNTETDFVARNDQFQSYVSTIAALSLNQGETAMNVEQLAGLSYPETGRTACEELRTLIATIGENMQVRRVAFLSTQTGIVCGYTHASIAPNMGRIGVLVALESEGAGNNDALAETGHSLAMHIAACEPLCLSRDDLDAALVERERTLLANQARDSGKPEETIAKMVEGRLRKFYERVVLLEQLHVMDTKKTVAHILEEAGKKVGAPVRVTGFSRFKLGEGLDTTKSDDS